MDGRDFFLASWAPGGWLLGSESPGAQEGGSCGHKPLPQCSQGPETSWRSVIKINLIRTDREVKDSEGFFVALPPHTKALHILVRDH